MVTKASYPNFLLLITFSTHFILYLLIQRFMVPPNNPQPYVDPPEIKIDGLQTQGETALFDGQKRVKNQAPR